MAGGPGRPPKGPKLVQSLEGSAHARKRLETVLETIAGGMSVSDACERLGVSQTAFYKMRAKALSAAMASLEPKALGRPPRRVDEKDRKIDELGSEIERLRKAVVTSQVREELALVMPFLPDNQEWREQFEKPRGEKGRRRNDKPGTEEERRAGDGATAADTGGTQRAQEGGQNEVGDGGDDASDR